MRRTVMLFEEHLRRHRLLDGLETGNKQSSAMLLKDLMMRNKG